MNKLYLISFDNGEPYEDNSRWPVLICNSQEKADSLISEWTEWAKTAAQGLPPEFNPEPNVEISEEEWEKQYDKVLAARETYINGLVYPCETVKGELTTIIYEQDSIYRGHFVVAEVDHLS